jgi:hypothetical protein
MCEMVELQLLKGENVSANGTPEAVPVRTRVRGPVMARNDTQRPNRLLWIMCASYFAFGCILNVVGVVIPIVINQYHLSLFAGGLLAFAFYISFGVFSIPAGVVADRLGAKRVVVSGILFMGIGCGAIPFATGFKAITVFAFLIGAGVAQLQTAGNPLIGLLDRPEHYHRNLTLTIACVALVLFQAPSFYPRFRRMDSPGNTFTDGLLCSVPSSRRYSFLQTFQRRSIKKREESASLTSRNCSGTR